MKNLDESVEAHPNPIDRNRAILWARDLMQFPDWIVLSVKTTRQSERTSPDECAKIVSIGVLGPHDNILLDVLVRPVGAVSNELLRMHGCEPARAFKAPSFEDSHKILAAGFAKTRILCWSPSRTQQALDSLCAEYKLPELKGRWISVQSEYSKFVGELENQAGYLMQRVPNSASSEFEGISTITECKKISEVVRKIAASSQVSDSALTFNKNWSAAFFRPKLNPTSKIREILGLPE